MWVDGGTDWCKNDRDGDRFTKTCNPKVSVTT